MYELALTGRVKNEGQEGVEGKWCCYTYNKVFIDSG